MSRQTKVPQQKESRAAVLARFGAKLDADGNIVYANGDVHYLTERRTDGADEADTTGAPRVAATATAQPMEEGATRQAPATPEPARVATLAQVEHRHIERVLAECDGNRSEAARRLGISVRNLFRKLKEYTT